ncbi:stage II sporulation protein M [Candidatus Pacearchaeota archaeon]|nr:stage II sporulation protein M [Candidatus Pacearchaeota archaeon]
MRKKKRERKNNINIKKDFKEATKYISESKNYIYSVIMIFVASTIVGFFLSDQLKFIDKILEQIIDKTVGLNTTELIFFILQNNFQSALFGLVLGIALGILPIINALTNGVLLGYVLERTYPILGASVLFRLIPHGVFELPAIFISLGLGLKLGLGLFHSSKELKRRFFQSLNTFLMVIVPLLIIAAIIEGILIGLSS